MPGTGDAPLPVMPGSERIYSAMIDHVQARADLDGARIVVRGQSWGSYWSARTGYAEAGGLKGVVFQSGPVHHYFPARVAAGGVQDQGIPVRLCPVAPALLGQHTVERRHSRSCLRCRC